MAEPLGLNLDYSIKIGGEAGQGIQTVGDIVSRYFCRSGYYLFSHQDYESRIRGGHNFYQIRLSDRAVFSSKRQIDILIALDRASIAEHRGELNPKGVILYDSSELKEKLDSPLYIDVPFSSISFSISKSKILINTAAVGATLGVLGMDIDALSAILREIFRKKGDEVVNNNIRAAREGYDFVRKNCKLCGFQVSGGGKKKALISGIDAIGIGAIASGLRFYSAYTMTPSTGLMNYISSKASEFGIVVEQAEDEISAINMAIGASFAGVRSMTATAGGGFALMVEGLSLSAMTETPVVIALGQRPAPATGLPTRTEQADLLFALHAGHGEFPRVVFAPGTPDEAIRLTNKAFDLSEKYQVPAIVLFDQHLADSQWAYDDIDIKGLRQTDYRLREGALKGISQYRRHEFTATGVSLLALPGRSKHLVVTDSDEHDEEGHISEDIEIRKKMVQKRLIKKLPLIRKEISPPLIYGSDEPEVVLSAWGSNYGVVKEIVDELSKNTKIAMVYFSEINPMPEGGRWLDLLKNSRLSIIIENNATSQFARHLRAETGFVFKETINKYDGRCFLFEDLLKEIDAKLRGL